MQITITQLTTLFNDFNAKYFEGMVSCSLHTYSRRSRVFGFMRRRSGIREIHINKFRLEQMTEGDLHETLIHEMVHAFLTIKGLPCGHTPLFKSIMRDRFERHFGQRATGNVRFKQHVPTVIPTVIPTPAYNAPKTAPVAPTINVPAPVTINGQRLIIISNGKLGILQKTFNLYGKLHVTLTNVEGCLFPFTTELANTRPA